MLMTGPVPAPTRVRSLFLSDIHLGSRACRAEQLLSLLKQYECDNIFLLGDIVDFWAIRGGIYWPAEHNTVVQKILRKARHHVQVVLIPGNHDEALRDYVGSTFGEIRILRDYVHVAADGKRYLLLHGDEYDQVTHYQRWMSALGDASYSALVHLNRLLSLIRRKLYVSGHWSLADYVKRNMTRAVTFVNNFEHAVVRDAKRRGVAGVICGHIHTPALKQIDGMTYINCGDWVDNCTAITEHFDGRMELVRWTPLADAVPETPVVAATKNLAMADD